MTNIEKVQAIIDSKNMAIIVSADGSIAPPEQGDARKNAEATMMILGFSKVGWMWESKDGICATVSADGTIWIQ